MLRFVLLFGLAAVLAGCGDTVKPPANGAGSSGVGAGPAEPVEVAKSDTPPPKATKNRDEVEEMSDDEPAGSDDAGGSVKTTAAGKKGTDEDDPGDDDGGDESPRKITMQKAIQAANRAMLKDGLKAAFAELEKAVPDNPKNIDLLLNLAALSQKVADEDKNHPDFGFYKKGADYLRRALKVDESLAEKVQRFSTTVYYNEARALAKEEKLAEALKGLQMAVDNGFRDIAQLEKDDELESVRKLAEYPELFEKIRERLNKEVDEIFAETKPFKFTFTTKDIDGKAISMSDLKGKVAIIDVWGTWCPPCRMEVPHFIALQEKYRDAGLEIVGLNVENGDPEDAVKTIQEFHKEHEMNYRCALVDNDFPEKIPEFGGFPTTLFCDRTGKVRAMAAGYHDLDTLDAIVSRLLEEKTGDNPGAEENSGKEAKPDDAAK